MKSRASLLAFALATGCSRRQTSDPAVHTLRLPVERVQLPEGPGRVSVESSCVGCHSARYVLDQPRLPRKTWKAEVEKMRTAYGAPVAATDVEPIVEYLVTVRGDGT